MTKNPSPSGSALVLFSGGQDSSVCLAWACERYSRVETLGLSYGQRHVIEMEARLEVIKQIKQNFPRWAGVLADDHVIDLSSFGQISDTALTRDASIEMTASGLPTTFVPGRNLLFFTYAAALGYRRSIFDLIGGMCETDYSGYPDCRDKTLHTLNDAINLGMDRSFDIITPLMFLDKAATWAMTDDLGGQQFCDLIIKHTHTCYLGNRTRSHDWGSGCGKCPACKLRENGYRQWQKKRTTTSAT